MPIIIILLILAIAYISVEIPESKVFGHVSPSSPQEEAVTIRSVERRDKKIDKLDRGNGLDTGIPTSDSYQAKKKEKDASRRVKYALEVFSDLPIDEKIIILQEIQRSPQLVIGKDEFLTYLDDLLYAKPELQIDISLVIESMEQYISQNKTYSVDSVFESNTEPGFNSNTEMLEQFIVEESLADDFDMQTQYASLSHELINAVDSESSDKILMQLLNISRKETVEIIVARLQHTDPEIRLAAGKFLVNTFEQGMTESEELISTLELMAQDNDEYVGGYARYILASLEH